MGSQTSKGGGVADNPKPDSSRSQGNPFTTTPIVLSNSLNTTNQNTRNTSAETKIPDKSLNENGDYINTLFRWNYEGSEVYVTGTFTGWKDHIKLQNNGNEFMAILALPKGIHRYKFIVDGEWRFSPDDNNSPDENGNINNIIDTSEYSIQTSFQGYYQGKNSLGTSFRFLNAPTSVTRGTNNSIDPKNSSLSAATTHITKFFEDEIEFGQDAPEIPKQLLDIYYISEKERKTENAWNMHLMNHDYFRPQNDKNINDGIFRALESFNALSPPSHVILNHLGIRKKDIEDEVSVYVLTERFKAKYVTMKFYTSQAAN